MLKYVDRRGTDCCKWDMLEEKYGDKDLIAMWVADMDFEIADPIRKAVGNYAFWTVPASGGSLSDEAFVKATLDEFGAKLAAGSDGSVDATTNTSTKKWQIFSGQARYTTAPYYTSSGTSDENHSYYVFMAGVSVEEGVKLTGDYAVITITWE